ncbi:MFS transporter [Kineococcus radiotolerans]|uniref:Lysosomal dipeptide transporter MFSD1 n=1 Tax=Kineococcus radiotolerans (strain ATCC BAA-149 / DSM 14245 / SRS30216) TaxID=266940 RepID=A6W872_KINRD|nr:MFS transporter [Kineococcus radiotolerans]ABS03011.1 major facilitator superfamily MFS_1 [Kineococcus radiotolerans SRS30216 = ATCC BAA-149]
MGTATAARRAPVARGAWLVFTVGALAYVVTVGNRTSLAAAGLEAQERYGIGAGTLSSFAVLQFLVYAALQVPVGVLIDRWGPRRLVVAGAVAMGLGQALLAVSTGTGQAVLARVLVGAGDAATFVSVLRVVTNWFPPQRVPVMTQLVGLFGQLGQVFSFVPLVALLHGPGWTAAYGGVAGFTLLTAVLAVLVLRDVPPGVENPRAAKPLAAVAGDLRAALRHPEMRLGLWSHWATPFSGNAFAALWGYPFLVSGQGLGPGTASALLTLYTVSAAGTGPLMGSLVARHPLRRSWIVLAVVGGQSLVWSAVLLWPGAAPVWLLAVLVVVVATGIPGSMIGFDYARTSNPAHRLGGATGMTNVMGFTATIVLVALIGLLLDLQGAGTPQTYSLEAFKVAFAVQLPLWAVGVAGILVSRRQTRRLMARDGVVVPRVRDAVRERLTAARGR